MRFSIVVSALVALASAQQYSITDLPKCSLPCFIADVPATGCGLTDLACQCTTKVLNELTPKITACVAQDCPSTADQQMVITVVNGLCKPYGVQIPASATEISSGAGMTTPMTSTAAAFTPTGSPVFTFTGAAGVGTAYGFDSVGRTVGGLGGAAAAILMAFGF